MITEYKEILKKYKNCQSLLDSTIWGGDERRTLMTESGKVREETVYTAYH